MRERTGSRGAGAAGSGTSGKPSWPEVVRRAGFAAEIGKATGDTSTENEGKLGQAKSNLKDAGEKAKDAFTEK